MAGPLTDEPPCTPIFPLLKLFVDVCRQSQPEQIIQPSEDLSQPGTITQAEQSSTQPSPLPGKSISASVGVAAEHQQLVSGSRPASDPSRQDIHHRPADAGVYQISHAHEQQERRQQGAGANGSLSADDLRQEQMILDSRAEDVDQAEHRPHQRCGTLRFSTQQQQGCDDGTDDTSASEGAVSGRAQEGFGQGPATATPQAPAPNSGLSVHEPGASQGLAAEPLRQLCASNGVQGIHHELHTTSKGRLTGAGPADPAEPTVSRSAGVKAGSDGLHKPDLYQAGSEPGSPQAAETPLPSPARSFSSGTPTNPVYVY